MMLSSLTKKVRAQSAEYPARNSRKLKFESLEQRSMLSAMGLETGLVGHWTLDEGSGSVAADVSGNNNHGSLVNGTGWANGTLGGAANFDGVNDRIDVGNPASLQLTGAMTAAAWVFIDDFDGNGRIVSKQGLSGQRGWSLNVEGAGYGAFQVAVNGNTMVVAASSSLPTGQWVHLAGVFRPGEAVQLFVNGQLSAEVTSGVPGAQYNSAEGVAIGNRESGITPFDGRIDDVRVYDRALSTDEIECLFTGEEPPASTNTYQSEDASVGGGSLVESNHAGHHGSGFVNFNTSGGFVEWEHVNVSQAGTYELTFRYALGNSQRNARLIVNGQDVSGGITFAPTGAWTNWAEVTVEVELDAGENKIRVQSSGQDAGNIDEMTVAFQSAPPGGGGGDLQAEAALVGGGSLIESNHAGHNGTGFVNFNSNGGFVEWQDVNASQSGVYELTLRYALGNSQRNARLIVNGQDVAGGITFAPTGAWTNWAEVTVEVSLSAGNNTIRVQSSGQDAGNIDELSSVVFVSPNPNPDPEPVLHTSFAIDLPANWTSQGGIITYDVNSDGSRDFLISHPTAIVAYEQDGTLLWKRSNPNIQLGAPSESNGLPGHHGPGLQAGDIDSDGQAEVLYVTQNNRLIVLNGRTGQVEHNVALPAVSSYYNRWEHAIIADFRGTGDNDLLLQASVNLRGASNPYLRDSTIAAVAIDELLSQGAGADLLWSYTGFVAPSHGPGKVADLDLDGRDEVVGGMILSPTGQLLANSGIGNTAFPHIDSVDIADIDPNRPGLEVVIPEESGQNRVIMFGLGGVYWVSTAMSSVSDGDKVQVGDFDLSRPGLESWFRHKESDRMWVLDRNGNKIADYDFDSRSPATWTNSGIESISDIHWTGGPKQYAAGKERHESDDVGIFDPMNGTFLVTFDESADRVYVADVAGDWREELIVISGDSLAIYQNNEANPNPGHASLWSDPLYRRQKMTWNYYSP